MKLIRYLAIIIGIAGLIGVRVFENQLFYDPFLPYFKQSGENLAFPIFSWGALIGSYLFRFFLNFLCSLLVVHFIFLNKQWTIQAGILMLIVFGIVFPIYLLCIGNHFEIGEMFVFYIRRFVIQPMTLLLIIPLFYYRKHINKS